MNRESASSKKDYISLANVISAAAVVYLHANACFWTFSDDLPYWKSANIIEGLFFFAVPVFLMNTGATLIDYRKRYGIAEYFRKRVRKTVIPYLFWSIAGLLFQLFIVGGISKEEVSAVYILNGLLTGHIVYYYYFFIGLFAVYLCIPLFAAVAQESMIRVFTYLAAVTVFFNALIPAVIYCSGYDIAYDFSVPAAGGYLLYILLGYILSGTDFSKKTRIVFYLAGLLGLVLKILLTYHFSMSAGVIAVFFEDYLSLPAILYSCGIYVFFRYEGEKLLKNASVRKAVRFLSDYTMGYYLLHFFVLRLFIEYLPVTVFSPVYRFVLPVPAIIIMTVFIWLIRKIPAGRWILP